MVLREFLGKITGDCPTARCLPEEDWFAVGTAAITVSRDTATASEVTATADLLLKRRWGGFSGQDGGCSDVTDAVVRREEEHTGGFWNAAELEAVGDLNI